MISEKDGMVMVYVPAGEFTMGSNEGFSNEQPVHQVYLDAFWVDQTEVTNEMYAKCVDSGDCDSPSNTRYIRHSYYVNHPVIYVNWNSAKSYCEWVGRRLPTESEWEKAARGVDARTYPWGENISCNIANFTFDLPVNWYWGVLDQQDCVGGTTKVGNYQGGKSPYGIYDMGGNVWEWVTDWYDSTYYQISPLSNPLGPKSSINKVIRGGAWNSVAKYVRTTARYEFSRLKAVNYLGFRCAFTP